MCVQVSLKGLGAEVGNHKQVEELLAGVVEDLIKESAEEQRKAPCDEMSEPLGPEDGHERPVRLPLIRLQVGICSKRILRVTRSTVEHGPDQLCFWPATYVQDLNSLACSADPQHRRAWHRSALL